MGKSILVMLLIGLGGISSVPAQSVSAQEPFVATNMLRSDFWDTDGTVNAIVATNGRVYVGGSFSYVAPKRQNLAAFDLHTAELDGEFPNVFGSSIHTIIEDGQGGWFVGGKFTRVGAVARTNLVHILSDNTVDPDFNPGPDDAVRALALEGTRLFIGGDFTRIGGQVRNRIAAFDLPNRVMSAWAPEADDTVSVLHASRGTLYVGGYFTNIGGESRGRIAALDTFSGAALPWAPQADGAVLTLGLIDQSLFVGGFFNSIGGQLRSGLAALDIRTTNALPWDPNPVGGKVTAVRVSCDTVYVSGYFTNIAGATRYRAAALQASSGEALLWNPNLDRYYSDNLDSYVLTLELYGQAVYLGGEFTLMAGLRHDLLAVDAVTGQHLPWNPMANGRVTALAVAGRKVLAGFVASPGGVERQNLAAFDQVTGKVIDWNPSADGPVAALVLGADTIYAGGSFTRVNGLTRNRLVAINVTSGQVDPDWNPVVNSNVFALALHGSRLYVGGSFSSLGPLTRHRLGALDVASGTVVINWAANANGDIYSLAVTGTRLYAGGFFSTVKGYERDNIVALDAASSAVVEAWAPDADQTVQAIAVVNNTVFVGGSFTSIGGQARNHLAALDLISGAATAWNPDAEYDVHALAWSGAALYLGGTFRAVAGQERFGCAAVDLDGNLLDWDPGVSAANRVYAFGLSENTLYVGGTGELGLKSSPALHSLAAFPRAGAPTLVQTTTDQSAFSGQAVQFQVTAAGTTPLLYQWSFNEIPIPGETSATLLLQNVQPGQAGVYGVIVSNSLGTITAEASLTVLQAVAILSQPAAQTVQPGTTVTLSVTAAGSPPPLYQWRRNGVNIPGAVFPTLTLANVTPADGGTYHVVIANRLGVESSDLAEVVVVTALKLPFHDDFNLRGTIFGASGLGSGGNRTATAEVEERHAGKRGGKSVWLSWTAPSSGVATFNTRGSTFDTLLAVYTGTALANLEVVASDEDRGGFLTSYASFNAVAGTEYLIAVDGLAGAAGQIVLEWLLDSSASAFPRITAQPVSVAVGRGERATFEVAATSATFLTYQWFFGCHEIAGATSSNLVVSNVQTRDVGSYRVVIRNDSTHPAESLPAALEIGSSRFVLSFDKLEDAVAAGEGGGGGGDSILVSVGTQITQTFDTTGYGTGLLEPNFCGSSGGALSGLRFQPLENGQVLLDTIGSQFNTVLAVFHNTNLLAYFDKANPALLACDDNGAPDGVRSQLIFSAVAGTNYLAVVDGVRGDKGLAVINWQLGIPPGIVAPTTNIIVSAGTAVTLHAGIVSRTLNTTYRWRLDGFDLPGRTGDHFTITNFQALQSGTYSVVASNFAGMVTNIAATITLAPPCKLVDWAQTSEGQLRFRIVGHPSQAFGLQVSTNLTGWTTLFTNRIPTEPFTFIETNSWKYRSRFYRVIEE